MTRTPAHRLFLALAGTPLDTRPDAELLDRFARYGERPALEAVVKRHAGLVRGVCRRHLGPTADADDAFQATFLVLLRHVGRGRPPAKVGPWLYSVAVRTAARLRSRRRFAPLPEVAAPEVPAADWLPLLDRELAGLPAKYRDALVLCELQGKSRRKAAAALGIAEGTLSSRLSRGRELLRRRLLKHGTLLPAAGLGLVAEAASAETITAAVGLADGAVPAAVAAAVPPAGWGLWKLVAADVAACVVGGLAAVPGEDTPKAGEPAKPAVVTKAEPAKPVGPAVPDHEALQGVWLFEDYLIGDAGKQLLPAAWAKEMEKYRATDRLVIHGDRWFQVIGGGVNGRVFTLTPARTPKWLDLRDRSSPPKISRGIYSLAGDRLTVATSGDGWLRPADLGPTDDPERVETTVFRKGPPADPVTAVAAKPLLGRWTLVRHRSNRSDYGPVTEQAFGGWLEVLPDALFFQTRQYKGHNPHPAAAAFTLDPAKDHPWIDLTLLTEGEGKPAKRYGVYELAGDTLRLCVGDSRTFRPLDFAVEPRTADLTDADQPMVEAFEFKRAAP